MINTEGYFKAVTKYWLCCPQPLPVPLTKRPERKGKNKQKTSKEKQFSGKKENKQKINKRPERKGKTKKSKEKQISEIKERKYKKSARKNKSLEDHENKTQWQTMQKRILWGHGVDLMCFLINHEAYMPVYK